MAKKISAAEATKKVTERDKVQTLIGNFLADSRGEAVDRLREGILIATDEGDIIVKVIAKKEEIEFTEEDVLETYEPSAE